MVNDIVQAFYTYYTILIVVFVYLYFKHKLNKQTAIYVTMFTLPIVVFAYFHVFNFEDLVHNIERLVAL